MNVLLLLLLVWFCRLQVSEALAAAEPYREQLERRGVLVVPLPVYGGDAGGWGPGWCVLRYLLCMRSWWCECSMLQPL